MRVDGGVLVATAPWGRGRVGDGLRCFGGHPRHVSIVAPSMHEALPAGWLTLAKQWVPKIVPGAVGDVGRYWASRASLAAGRRGGIGVDGHRRGPVHRAGGASSWQASSSAAVS